MTDFFDAQEDDVQRRLRLASTRKGTRHWDYGDAFDPSIEKKAIDAGDLFDPDDWPIAGSPIGDGIERIWETVGLRAADSFGFSFDLHDPRVTEAILARQNLVSGANDTTYSAIQRAVAEGERNGETIPQISRRISGAFDQARGYRARMIARTETISSANAAATEGARQSGQVEAKRWLSASDGRTRDAHVTADGQTVGLDDPYTVNGEQIDHPGLGSAANAINCRCTQTFVRGTRKARQPASIEEIRDAAVARRPGLARFGDSLTIDADDLSILDDPKIGKWLDDLDAIPDEIVEAVRADGVEVYVSTKPITKLPGLGHLEGVTPRGWPPGSTWDEAGGLFDSGAKRVYATTNGRGGSVSTVLHEYGHALDDVLRRTGDRRLLARFDAAWARGNGGDRFLPYFSQSDLSFIATDLDDVWRVAAGQQESFAEAFSHFVRLKRDDVDDFARMFRETIDASKIDDIVDDWVYFFDELPSALRRVEDPYKAARLRAVERWPTLDRYGDRLKIVGDLDDEIIARRLDDLARVPDDVLDFVKSSGDEVADFDLFVTAGRIEDLDELTWLADDSVWKIAKLDGDPISYRSMFAGPDRRTVLALGSGPGQYDATENTIAWLLRQSSIVRSRRGPGSGADSLLRIRDTVHRLSKSMVDDLRRLPLDDLTDEVVGVYLRGGSLDDYGASIFRRTSGWKKKVEDLVKGLDDAFDQSPIGKIDHPPIEAVKKARRAGKSGTKRVDELLGLLDDSPIDWDDPKYRAQLDEIVEILDDHRQTVARGDLPSPEDLEDVGKKIDRLSRDVKREVAEKLQTQYDDALDAYQKAADELTKIVDDLGREGFDSWAADELNRVIRAGGDIPSQAELWKKWVRRIDDGFGPDARAVERSKEAKAALAKVRKRARLVADAKAELEGTAGRARLLVLDKIRPMGVQNAGGLQITNSTLRGSAKIVDRIADLFPSDWIEKSNAHRVKLRITKTDTGRARYSSGGRLETDVPSAKRALRSKDFDVAEAVDAHSVATHELGHRMEQVNPIIARMEADYLRYRAGVQIGDDIPLAEIYRGSDEYGVPGIFDEHYAGKWYGDRLISGDGTPRALDGEQLARMIRGEETAFFEIFTMSVEDVYWTRRASSDVARRRWALAVLALA